jgi:hypothetical protein
MERCLECNSLLTKEEKVCVECGTKVGGDEKGSAQFVASIVSALFYVSALTMCVSPFVDKLPSFMFCMLMTSALLFVMRTAKDNTQKVRKK